uniref:RPAP1 family, C-terminal protein n=1 Tax=Neospora caninum (strain Liverpool) TaxID=572307 RepID=A0A0F7UM50_NEOCL|nr:TPA: RPAP1 family, C-terminal protein [Neospora caninum Liverpool]
MADPSNCRKDLSSECRSGYSSDNCGPDSASSSSSRVSPGGGVPARRQPSVFKLSASTTPLGRVSLFPPVDPLRFPASADLSASSFRPSGRTRASRIEDDFSLEAGNAVTPSRSPTPRSFFASAKSTRFALNPYEAEEQANAERHGSPFASDGFPGVGGVFEKSKADAEIAQLAIRETEEDGSLSAFVLGSVVERNASSESSTGPSVISTASASDSLSASLSRPESAPAAGGGQGPRATSSTVPSYAAVEAPYGFPVPVHRSLLSRRDESEAGEAVPRLEGVCRPAGEAGGGRAPRGQEDAGAPGGWRLSKKAFEEIEDHNLEILRRMQPHEIREAQEEILQRFGTKRFAVLQRRALRRAQAVQRGGGGDAGAGDSTRGVGDRGTAQGKDGEGRSLQAPGASTGCPDGEGIIRMSTKDRHGGATPSMSPSAACSSVSPSCIRSSASSALPASSSSASFALPGGGKCILEWSVDPRVLSEKAGVKQRIQNPASASAFVRDEEKQAGGKCGTTKSTQSAQRISPETAVSGASPGVQEDAKPRGAKSYVRFDIQEAAKLQWANPLGDEDAHGGPVEEAGEEEWGEAEVKAIATGSARPRKTPERRIRIERLRFDFDGKLRSQVFAFQALWQAAYLLQQIDKAAFSSEALSVRSLRDLVPADPLEYHRGLHHHGDEAALPGYTLGELFQLAQSASRPQAALAVRTLGAVLRQSRTLVCLRRWRGASPTAIRGGTGTARGDPACECESEFTSVLASVYLGGATEKGKASGETFPLLPRLALSDSAFVSAFGVGFPRWRRFVFRDLFLCWRLASLLQQQTPAMHRAALVALDAAVSVPTRDETVVLADVWRRGDGAEESGERGGGAGRGHGEDGEDGETGDGEGEFRWRGVVWGGSRSFPFFLETCRKSAQRAARTRGNDEAAPEHPIPSRVSADATEANTADFLNRGEGQMSASGPWLHSGRRAIAGEAGEGGTGKKREAQDTASAASSPGRREGTSDPQKQAVADRVCLYGLGGFDLVEEGDIGFPLLTFAGPGGGEEEKTGCGGACTFWQALCLRVRAHQRRMSCHETEEPQDPRPRRVQFSAPDGDSAEENPTSEDEEDVSIAELFFRHPISSLLTYSPLLDRLSLFFSTYEGDEEIERSCLRLLLACSLLGPSAAEQIVRHPALLQRLQHLAQSLIVGSSARGLRIQRQGAARASTSKGCDASAANRPQHLTPGEVYGHMLSTKKAEATALVERCGTPLSVAERRVLLDLLRLLRCVARWGNVQLPASDGDVDAGEALWGEASSTVWALINQSIMEGASVVPRLDGKRERTHNEQGEQLAEPELTRLHDDAAQGTRLTDGPSSEARPTHLASVDRSGSLSAVRTPVAEAWGGSETFRTEVQQLLAAAEALRVMRVAVSRSGKPDEFAVFFPVLSTYAHQFATVLQQVYGEALLLRLLLETTASSLPPQEQGPGTTCELLPPTAASPLACSLPPSLPPGLGGSARKLSQQVASLDLQAETIWTFHGSVAREVFLWAALSLEKRRRDRRDERERLPLSGMEGASLLGPVPVLLRLFWQLKPHASSLPSRAAFRVVQTALQLASAGASQVLRSLLPAPRSKTSLSGRCAAPARAEKTRTKAKTNKRDGPAGLPASVSAGATYGNVGSLSPMNSSTKKGEDGEPSLSDNGSKASFSSASASEKQALAGDGKQDAKSCREESEGKSRNQTARVAWTRDEELLFFRWLRSSRPILDALLCETREESSSLGSIFSPKREREDTWNSQSTAFPSPGVPCIQVMKQMAVKLNWNGDRAGLAASFTAYAVETGWASGIRCCCQRHGADVRSAGKETGTKHTETLGDENETADSAVARRRASQCWRGGIPATSENFASLPLERESSFVAGHRCNAAGSLTREQGFGEEQAESGATEETVSLSSSPFSCDKTASCSRPSCKPTAFRGECSDHACLFDHGRKNLEANRRNALPHDIERILTEARFLVTVSEFLSMAIYLVRRASTLAAAPRAASQGPDGATERVFEDVFPPRLLRALGISATSLCRSLNAFLLALFQHLRWPEPLVGRRRRLDACGSILAFRGKKAEKSESRGIASASGSASASSGVSPSSAPPLRSHEASACSGPLLLFDILARLMLALLGLRRLCTVTASALAKEEEGQEDASEAGYGATLWTAREEQECLLAAFSAATTSHTFLKCTVSLYSNTVFATGTSERLQTCMPSELYLPRSVGRKTPNSAGQSEGEEGGNGKAERGQLLWKGDQDEWRQKWIAAAAEWFVLCFPPSGGTSPHGVARQRFPGPVSCKKENSRHNGVSFATVYRALSAVITEVDARQEDEAAEAECEGGAVARRQESLCPAPLCLLQSLDDLCSSCSSVSANVGEDEAAYEHTEERSVDATQREGSSEDKASRETLHGELPCVPLFVSPLDALVGGSLWGSLGLHTSSSSCSGVPGSGMPDTKSVGQDGKDAADRGYDRAFPLVFLLRAAPHLVEDLGHYFPPCLLLSGLLLFYTEPSIANGVAGLCRVRASSRCCHSVDPNPQGERPQQQLEDLWWLLDAWVLQPLGKASMYGHLLEADPLSHAVVPGTDQGKGTEAAESKAQKESSVDGTTCDPSASPQTLDRPGMRGEGQSSLSFSDAFMTIWKAVSARSLEEAEACIDNAVVLALRTKKCGETSGLERDFERCGEEHDGEEGRYSGVDLLCPQSKRRSSAAPNASDKMSAASRASPPTAFPLCCAKAHDVLLTRAARLVLRAQTSEETSDPVLFLLLWLLAFSPAFPVECRRLTLSEGGILTLADRTFFLSLGGAADTVGDGTEEDGEDACGAGRRPYEGEKAGNQMEAQADEGGNPKLREASSAEPNAGDVRKTLRGSHPSWGVITPHGSGLWGLREASWWLMRPGGFPPEARDELLTCYRSFLRARLSHGFLFFPESAALLCSNTSGVNPNKSTGRDGGYPLQGLLTVQALAALVRVELGTFPADSPFVAPDASEKEEELSESSRRELGLAAYRKTRDNVLCVVRRLVSVLGANSTPGGPEFTELRNIDSLVRQLSEAVQGLFDLEHIARKCGIPGVRCR